MTNQATEFNSTSLLSRFLTGINESVFLTKMGIANIELVNYLTGLLIQFIRTDAIPVPSGQAHYSAIKLLHLMDEAEKSGSRRRRNLYQAIGDYTLFYAGVYPESVEKPKQRHTSGWLRNLTQHGKYCYALASKITPEGEQPSKQVLQCLSHQYELCTYGLRETRREWEQSCSKPEHLIV
ncbi:MAG: hypothetical protein L7U72_13955 [Rubripirellula sp.]|nr:hypothetical protein [Rubripirellula sp.]